MQPFLAARSTMADSDDHHARTQCSRADYPEARDAARTPEARDAGDGPQWVVMATAGKTRLPVLLRQLAAAALLAVCASAPNCSHAGRDMMGATCADYGAGTARWSTNNVPLMDQEGKVSLFFNLSCSMRSSSTYYGYDLPGCCEECALTTQVCDATMPLNQATDADWTPWNRSACDTPGADACAMAWRRGLVTGGTYPPSAATEPERFEWCRDVAGVHLPFQRLPCSPQRCNTGCRPTYSWYEVDSPPFNLSDERAAEHSLAVSDVVMLGWVTQANGSLTFEAGAANFSRWTDRLATLKRLGFRVQPYIEFNPGGAIQVSTNTSLAEAFYKQVVALMQLGFDGLQYSVEGCVAAEKPLRAPYMSFISGLKRAIGDKELGVWIHETCDTPETDFCLTCVDYASTALDRVIYCACGPLDLHGPPAEPTERPLQLPVLIVAHT